MSLLTSTHRSEPITWASRAMRDLEAELACVVQCDLNVLITGENGVGKRSIARRIYRHSRRAGVSLVIARSPGRLDSADAINRALMQAMPAGAILLENVERMSHAMQSRLLGFIDRPVARGRYGWPFVRPRHVRVITATCTDLFGLVQVQQFSEALFYRLNAIHLIVPPLRSRPEDIPVLLQHYLSQYASGPLPRLSNEARQRLVAHSWPGNMWELRAVAENLASCERAHVVEAADLPPDIGR